MQHNKESSKFSVITHRLGAQVSIASGYNTERLNILELRVLIRDLINAQKHLERNVIEKSSTGGNAA